MVADLHLNALCGKVVYFIRKRLLRELEINVLMRMNSLFSSHLYMGMYQGLRLISVSVAIGIFDPHME